MTFVSSQKGVFDGLDGRRTGCAVSRTLDTFTAASQAYRSGLALEAGPG